MTLAESSNDDDVIYNAGEIKMAISKSDDEAAGTVEIDYRKTPRGEGFFIDSTGGKSDCGGCSGSCK